MGNELHLPNTQNVNSEQGVHLDYQIAVAKVLSYFDVFFFPLTASEIQKFSSIPFTEVQLKATLNLMLSEGKIKNHEEYYLPSFSAENNVNIRKENEQRAKNIAAKVKRYSQLISRFPFVECVCISGSYSKGVISKDGDVDFFIITQPGKLWLSRTLLVLFKKIVLLNSRKYFCVNYFIDSGNLAIPDTNIFSATEISTLIPMYNGALYQEFIEKNKWIKTYLPNIEHPPTEDLPSRKTGLKRFLEWMLSGTFGNWLDNVCFRMTLNRWKRKFAHFNESDFDLNMRTRKHVSKHHPQGFQRKVLTGLNERMAKFNLH